jgi:hypothetical protein
MKRPLSQEGSAALNAAPVRRRADQRGSVRSSTARTSPSVPQRRSPRFVGRRSEIGEINRSATLERLTSPISLQISFPGEADNLSGRR